MDEISKRRSIRKYQTTDVSDEMIHSILEAGMSGPSAHNQRPWHFVVIKDREKLNAIIECHPYSKMLKEAPVAILVCSTLENLKAEDFWVQDCAAATENMLLEIVSQGLGGVWMGIYPKIRLIEPIRELFNLPKNIQPFSLIGLGYADEEKEERQAYDETRVHFNSW